MGFNIAAGLHCIGLNTGLGVVNPEAHRQFFLNPKLILFRVVFFFKRIAKILREEKTVEIAWNSIRS